MLFYTKMAKENLPKGIREIKIEKDKKGKYKRITIVFGPHYFVEIEGNKKTTFYLGATHHGFKADASKIDGELEKFIDEIKEKHKKNSF